MSLYNSHETDWIEYTTYNSSTYTKNLVDNGNGTFNLIVMGWDYGVASPIHNHPNSHCILKVLAGTLVEFKYSLPNRMSQQSMGSNVIPMNLIEKATYNRDQVTYIHDEIGVHKVFNPSKTERAVSLHLY
ncbi:32099_t:CDS:2, partial [Racocetra persica]